MHQHSLHALQEGQGGARLHEAKDNTGAADAQPDAIKHCAEVVS